MSKNDVAWQKYFDRTRALQQLDDTGFVVVSAHDLKEITGREPRLMAKQDTLRTRPKVFRDQQLAILPVRNGRYIVFRDANNRSYYRFASSEIELPAEIYHSEVDLHGFDAYPGSQSLNESQAIDFAHISSLLRTFTDADSLHLAIRSRIYSGGFQIQLPVTDHPVNVDSVQIEVDAGYESEDSIFLIEAKVGRRDDFHIRQLYYPYLEWSRRSKKRVVPIFLIYSNARYYLYEFAFSHVFGEVSLVRGNCYIVNETPHIDGSIESLLASISPGHEPDVPYPQANDLDKVIDLVGVIGQGVDNKFDIADHFDFDERQGDYYANAARYLDLVDRHDDGFRLTDTGEMFLGTRSLARRNQIVVSQILKRPSFRETFQHLADNKMDVDSVTTQDISAIIEKNTGLSGMTPSRRASTVRRWLAWTVKNIDSASS